jgi:putative tributyrin esterase
MFQSLSFRNSRSADSASLSRRVALLLGALSLSVLSALHADGSPPPNGPPQSAAAQVSAPAQREAKPETLEAESLGGARLPFRVLLPVGYERSSRRYPVLYLLHGLSGGENDWWKRTNLIQYAQAYQLIIVTPGFGDSWYANSATDAAARYEDVLVRDLIPYMDAHYRTISKRKGRAVAGLSMGGLGAVKFALRYPQLFAFAASFSGAFDVPLTAQLGKSPSPRLLSELRRIFGDESSQARRENNVFLLLQRGLPKGVRFPYLYISTGQSDALPQVSESNPRLARALREARVKFEYYERPGGHDWRFWDAEINFALKRMCDFISHACS